MTEQHQENQPEKNHSDVPMQIDQDQQLDSEAKLPADFRPAESSKACCERLASNRLLIRSLMFPAAPLIAINFIKMFYDLTIAYNERRPI